MSNRIHLACLLCIFALFNLNASDVNILSSDSSPATEPCAPNRHAIQRELLMQYYIDRIAQKSIAPSIDHTCDTPCSSADQSASKHPVRLRHKKRVIRTRVKKNAPSDFAENDEEEPTSTGPSDARRARTKG